MRRRSALSAAKERRSFSDASPPRAGENAVLERERGGGAPRASGARAARARRLCRTTKRTCAREAGAVLASASLSLSKSSRSRRRALIPRVSLRVSSERNSAGGARRPGARLARARGAGGRGARNTRRPGPAFISSSPRFRMTTMTFPEWSFSSRERERARRRPYFGLFERESKAPLSDIVRHDPLGRAAVDRVSPRGL